ncbi:MAG TPA: sigma-70 family RNA polymerase sigma factor [Terriglobia bacterium]|nr:sigma-70 family RNA polymerase sigma factor [Terriglobia bacterium]
MGEANFSDAGFLRRLKERDRVAWAELADAYLPQLLRAARGMGFTIEESQDLAQSVFAALIEGIGRFEGRSHIRTFLFGIFYNKVAEYLREKQRAEENDPIDEVMESKFDLQGKWRQPPLDIEMEIIARQMVERCLETVPRSQRIAFHLRAVSEMDTTEICNKMQITPTNLGVLLFRARNYLRECLERMGLKRG